jgi:hypothetical protein
MEFFFLNINLRKITADRSLVRDHLRKVTVNEGSTHMDNYQRKTKVCWETHLGEATADAVSTYRHQRKITGHLKSTETYLKEMFKYLSL